MESTTLCTNLIPHGVAVSLCSFRYWPAESSRCQLLEKLPLGLLVDSLSVIRLDVELTVLADVGEMRRDRPDLRAPPVTLTMTSGVRRTVRRICSIWAGVNPPRLQGAGPPTAEEIQERRTGERHTERHA